VGCTTDSVRTDSLSIGINLANPEGGGGISFSYRWDFRGFGGGIQKTEQLRTPNNLAASELQADTQVAWTTQGLLTDTETFSTTLSTSYANADGPVFSGVNTDISNRSVQSSFLIDMAAVVPIAIQSILFSPAEANPSQQPAVTGTVTLASPAKIDTVITLASNSLNATLLPTVTVPQGDSELHGVFGAGGGGSDCRYSVIERGERWLRAAYKPADVEVPEDRSQLVGQEVGGPRLLLQAQTLVGLGYAQEQNRFPCAQELLDLGFLRDALHHQQVVPAHIRSVLHRGYSSQCGQHLGVRDCIQGGCWQRRRRLTWRLRLCRIGLLAVSTNQQGTQKERREQKVCTHSGRFSGLQPIPSPCVSPGQESISGVTNGFLGRRRPTRL